MNIFIQLFLSISLISTVASVVVLVLFLFKPLTTRFLSLKCENYLLKSTLLLFFLPVHSVLGGLTFPENPQEQAPSPSLSLPVTTEIPDILPNFIPQQPQEESQPQWMDYLPYFYQAFVIWGIGAMISLCFQVYCYKRFQLSIQSAKEIHEETILSLFHREKETLGIHRTIPLCTSPKIPSPMVTGVIFPKIYLPEDRPIENNVLQHELIHYKNKDLWWKTLLTLGKIIHWWNPCLYLLGRDLEENMEYCCDAQVLQSLNTTEKKEYALTVLSTYENGQMFALGLNHRSNGLERRVKIMFEKKNKNSVIVASVTGFTLLFALGLSSDRAKDIIPTNLADAMTQFSINSSDSEENLAYITEMMELHLAIDNKINENLAYHSTTSVYGTKEEATVNIKFQNSNLSQLQAIPSSQEEDITQWVKELMPDYESIQINLLHEISQELTPSQLLELPFVHENPNPTTEETLDSTTNPPTTSRVVENQWLKENRDKENFLELLSKIEITGFSIPHDSVTIDMEEWREHKTEVSTGYPSDIIAVEGSSHLRDENLVEIFALEEKITQKIQEVLADSDTDAQVFILPEPEKTVVHISIPRNSPTDNKSLSSAQEEDIVQYVWDTMADWEAVNVTFDYQYRNDIPYSSESIPVLDTIFTYEETSSLLVPFMKERPFLVGETVLGTLEDDVGFQELEHLELYHPETGALMSPIEWVAYQEEQARLDFDIYSYLNSVTYVLAEEKPFFTAEDWEIVLETAKTRENFFFETTSDYFHYLEEAGLWTAPKP